MPQNKNLLFLSDECELVCVLQLHTVAANGLDGVPAD